MWIITEDKTGCDPDRTGAASVDHDQAAKLSYRFRLLDDDGEIYYEGLSDNDSDFSPLDDFGEPDAGCTEIQYFNAGIWEVL